MAESDLEAGSEHEGRQRMTTSFIWREPAHRLSPLGGYDLGYVRR